MIKFKTYRFHNYIAHPLHQLCLDLAEMTNKLLPKKHFASDLISAVLVLVGEKIHDGTLPKERPISEIKEETTFHTD